VVRLHRTWQLVQMLAHTNAFESSKHCIAILPTVVPVLWCLMCYAGTLIGCAPNNFMAANAGDHLSDLDSLADLYNPRMLLLGLTVGFVALLPVYVKHRHERGMALLAQKIR